MLTTTLQDVLTANQNWTLLGLFGALLVSGGGVAVWVVKWLCGQVTEQGKRFADSNDQHGKFVGENTQVLMRLKDSHDELREKVDDLPRLAADEIQRRKLG